MVSDAVIGGKFGVCFLGKGENGRSILSSSGLCIAHGHLSKTREALVSRLIWRVEQEAPNTVHLGLEGRHHRVLMC